ncbi:MAG: DUF3172 domain-containing protein [Elainellaceae cyanobacterium]
MARRPKPPLRPSRYSDRYDGPYEAPEGRLPAGKSTGGMLSSMNLAILGTALVIGIALGGLFFSGINGSISSNETIATRVEIEESVPNPEICAQFGAASMVVDLRAFVTLNPFKVFISQPLMRPGCVLRSNNWSVLEQRDLVSSQDVRQCKQRMNTFGFVGDLEQGADAVNVECVYENDAARNLFLKSGSRRGENSF